MTYFFFSYFAFRLFETFGTTPKDAGLEEALKKAEADEQVVVSRSSDGRETVRSDVLGVLVLPVWFRKSPGRVYQPSDPEFKEFARIQSDPKKMHALKNQVIDALKKRLKTELLHQKSLQYIQFTGTLEAGIDIVPQLRAPPSCESPAVVIFKDGVAIGWKVWKDEIGDRLLRILRPSATYEASKASVRSFFQVTRAMALASLDNKEVVFDGRRLTLRDLGHNGDKTANSIQLEQLLTAISGELPSKELHNELLANLPLSTAIQFSALSFRNAQRANMIAEQQRAARGAIQVRGNIRCVGQTGTYKMDVTAIYLPSEDKFLGPLIISNAFIWQDYSRLQSKEDQAKRNLRYPVPKLVAVKDIDDAENESKVDKTGK